MEQKKDKTIAAVLAILLGSFGIHLFYLGCTKKALYYLLGWVAIFVIVSIITVITLGFGSVLYILCWIPGILGIIDGIHYLTDKTQEDFEKRVEEEKNKIFNWELK